MDKYTKIIATIGPSSDSIEILRELYEAGMNVARLNFSHGNYDYFKKIISKIKKISPNIAILLDTKGPEIRSGELKNNFVKLKDNQELIFTKKNILGDDKKISINYKFLSELNVGNKILIDDGLIETKVIEKINGDEIKVKVLNGGELGSKKTVSIWGHNVNIPFLSKKDIEDIKFGIKEGVDFIAASFVRNANEVSKLKKLLNENKGEMIKIISKIEHSESVKNIDEIISVSDGIMIARGDLAVEIPPEKVPKIQKEIIIKCRESSIPVIVATQMLESMKNNPRPTRAEVSDVANAIMQGTDAIMLSGETANGKYPIKAVNFMSKIANEYDQIDKIELNSIMKNELNIKENSISNFITKSVYYATKQLKIKLILIPTVSGYTARRISSFRPKSQILALVHNKTILRQLQLSWGVRAEFIDKYYDNRKEMLNLLKMKSLECGFKLSDEDRVIVTSGFILNEPGHTNHIEIFKIKNM